MAIPNEESVMLKKIVVKKGKPTKANPTVFEKVIAWLAKHGVK